jgi:hypothetical protein
VKLVRDAIGLSQMLMFHDVAKIWRASTFPQEPG